MINFEKDRQNHSVNSILLSTAMGKIRIIRKYAIIKIYSFHSPIKWHHMLFIFSFS